MAFEAADAMTDIATTSSASTTIDAMPPISGARKMTSGTNKRIATTTAAPAVNRSPDHSNPPLCDARSPADALAVLDRLRQVRRSDAFRARHVRDRAR